MRALLAFSPLVLLAAPAAAAEQAPQLPPEITDGRVVDHLGDVVGAIARSLLDLPVGEVEAAVENRPVAREDRGKTVRTVTGVTERELDRGIKDGTEVAKAGTQAMVRALPAVTEALNEAGREIERAVANLPSPAYPRR